MSEDIDQQFNELNARLAKAERERDEARAEIERYRGPGTEPGVTWSPDAIQAALDESAERKRQLDQAERERDEARANQAQLEAFVRPLVARMMADDPDVVADVAALAAIPPEHLGAWLNAKPAEEALAPFLSDEALKNVQEAHAADCAMSEVGFRHGCTCGLDDTPEPRVED